MVMNISCKFEKASYNIFFVRAVKVKSLYTLRRRIEAKSIVSTRCWIQLEVLSTELPIGSTLTEFEILLTEFEILLTECEIL